MTTLSWLREQILVYLVYSCTEDKIAFFIPLKSKDGTFVLAKSTGQVPCGAEQRGQHLVSVDNGDAKEKVTNPDASRSLTGFQAQMKTSDSWPLKTMALF
ncbi:hypothetical protein EYF80_030255 [Liparis tanakae]|uniref:Uncharacterized protein n=1 Tax=Liparis tanakae TaxID=230148 RepID=A0A4Z2H1S6_9TELE|nr:hypothetical protein EYF80_030255 [Liparis tanakae]